MLSDEDENRNRPDRTLDGGWAVSSLTTDGATESAMVQPGSCPWLSWIPEARRQDARQTSYRVSAEQDGTRIWDTGLIASSDTVVHYAGPPLLPSTTYVWTVEITDDSGAVARAATHFETTLDDAVLRQATWIAADEDREAAPLFRRDLLVENPPVRARLHVAGLGLHRCTVNGVEVSDAHLESGFTDYDHTVLYSTSDVTDLLEQGPATIGVELGRGFYDMVTQNTWRWHAAPWRDQRKLWVRLEIVDVHGPTDVVTTDRSWTWTDGPTRFDSLYEGETFDARHDVEGWDRPGFDASGWRAVGMTEAPAGQLAPRRHEPVRITQVSSPDSWREVDAQTFVVDAGRTTAGWARITNQRLPAGTRVTLTYGEKLTEGGTVEAKNRHVLPSDRFQVDEIVLAEDTTWQSRFSYKGFRYIQVHGITSPEDIDLTVCDVHTDVEEVSSFHCSDPVLNWIDRAMRVTVANNLHHVPTDTPMMEKNGWTGDVHVAAETMLGQFDLHLLLSKWLDDLCEAQELAATGPRSPEGELREGRLPVIVPSPGWGYTEMSPSPEWTTVYPFLLHTLVRWYGTTALVDRHINSVLLYLDYELSRLDEHDLSVGSLGDWLAPGPKARPVDDLRIAASCYLYRALKLTVEVVDVLAPDAAPQGWPERRERLTQAAGRIRAAVNRTFLDIEAGLYRSDREPEYRQTSNVLPLAVGITPSEHSAAVVENLVADIHTQGNHHNAGCLGISQLLRVFTEHGHADLAVSVATQTSPPSWGAWQRAGETTMLEMWRPDSRSHDHYFMGTPAQWLYESVAGVRMLEPAWAAFSVDPSARGDLEHATYRLRTVRGELAVSWRQTASALHIDVTVPVGARARIHLPDQLAPVWRGSGHWSFSSGLSSTELANAL